MDLGLNGRRGTGVVEGAIPVKLECHTSEEKIM